MKVNNFYSEIFSFTQDEVIAFSQITGDKNPIHLDHEYADKTMFKSPIIHGFLSGSVFSKIIGMSFPGEGSIYLKQDLKFIKPMFVNIEYVATLTITHIDLEKKYISLETSITNKETGKPTITGSALVYYPKLA